MKKIINSFFAIIAFPILIVFFFSTRLIYNIITFIVDIILLLYFFFTFKFSEAIIKLLFNILTLLGIIIDVPIGIVVSTIISFGSAIDIINSEFDFIDTIKLVVNIKKPNKLSKE